MDKATVSCLRTMDDWYMNLIIRPLNKNANGLILTIPLTENSNLLIGKCQKTRETSEYAPKRNARKKASGTYY